MEIVCFSLLLSHSRSLARSRRRPLKKFREKNKKEEEREKNKKSKKVNDDGGGVGGWLKELEKKFKVAICCDDKIR